MQHPTSRESFLLFHRFTTAHKTEIIMAAQQEIKWGHPHQKASHRRMANNQTTTRLEDFLLLSLNQWGSCSPSSCDFPISRTGESAKRSGKEAEVCNSIGFHSPGSFQAPPVYKASERNKGQFGQWLLESKVGSLSLQTMGCVNYQSP
ncbi:Atp-Binding Cassette Sub-Family A Member 12 [Manis pentadactyla]|nr:Atp-Binding Cassette Sub-Family A Member 12 [Manis pentadactyla]